MTQWSEPQDDNDLMAGETAGQEPPFALAERMFRADQSGFAPNQFQLVLHDLCETLHTLWSQIILPASRACGGVLLMLWRESLQPGLITLGRQLIALSQSFLTRRAPAKATLSTRSAVSLSKIQGALQADWSSALARQAPSYAYPGKPSRWVKAQTHALNLPGGLFSTKNTADKRQAVTTTAQEEIRGLDDLFTGPIPGFFEETAPVERAAQAHRSPDGRAKHQTKGSQSLNTARQSTPRPDGPTVSGFRPEQKPRAGSAPAYRGAQFDESIRKQVRWPQPTPKPRTKTAPTPALVSAPLEKTVPVAAPAPVLSPAVTFPPLPSHRSPVAFSEKESGFHWRNLFKGKPKSVSADQGPAEGPPMQADPPAPLPQAASQSEPAFKKPATPNPADWTLDEELKDELQSIKHMARNNQIISNSISSLVDSYFEQAAQEEKPDYY